MQLGEPIGLLLALTFGVSVLGTNTGTDSLETISEVLGTAVVGVSLTDSFESITAINGSATTGFSYTDSLESITNVGGTPVTVDDDSLDGM